MGRLGRKKQEDDARRMEILMRQYSCGTAGELLNILYCERDYLKKAIRHIQHLKRIRADESPVPRRTGSGGKPN